MARGSLCSPADLERRIPSKHPLQTIRAVANDALASLDAAFDRLHAAEGRPSNAPERLIRADGDGERCGALDLIRRQSPGSTRRLTPGAGRVHDCADVVRYLRQAGVTPQGGDKRNPGALTLSPACQPALQLFGLAR